MAQKTIQVGIPALEDSHHILLLLLQLLRDAKKIVLEDVPQEESLEDIGNNVISKCDIGLKDIGNQPIVFLLPLGDVEDEAVEDAVRLDEERLELCEQVLAVREEIDALQRELEVLAAVEFLVQLDHVGLEPLHDLEEGLEVLQVVVLLRDLLTVDGVDVDGGVDLGAVDAVVVVADHLDVGEVGLEGALEEDEDVLLVSDLLALLLDLLLLDGELLDPVGDLVPDPREVLADLLVVLQHHDVLVDRLEEALPELLDLLRVYYVLPQQLLRQVDQHPVSVVRQVVPQRTPEDLQVYLVRKVPLQRG
jgi:hypothetical protein